MFYIPVVPRCHLPILVLLTLMAAAPAMAACTDPAAPGVVWRRCLLDGRDMSGVDLAGALLRDSSFQRGRLAAARMVGADATDARFTSADLSDADLTDATLREADFTRTDLRGAKLVRADLRRARFFRANLTGADLTGAVLLGADFSGATLDGVRWTDGERVCAVGSVGNCQ